MPRRANRRHRPLPRRRPFEGQRQPGVPHGLRDHLPPQHLRADRPLRRARALHVAGRRLRLRDLNAIGVTRRPFPRKGPTPSCGLLARNQLTPTAESDDSQHFEGVVARAVRRLRHCDGNPIGPPACSIDLRRSTDDYRWWQRKLGHLAQPRAGRDVLGPARACASAGRKASLTCGLDESPRPVVRGHVTRFSRPKQQPRRGDRDTCGRRPAGTAVWPRRQLRFAPDSIDAGVRYPSKRVRLEVRAHTGPKPKRRERWTGPPPPGLSEPRSWSSARWSGCLLRRSRSGSRGRRRASGHGARSSQKLTRLAPAGRCGSARSRR